MLKEADLVLTVGVKDIEAALTRPEPEVGIVPAGSAEGAARVQSAPPEHVIRRGTIARSCRLARVWDQELDQQPRPAPARGHRHSRKRVPGSAGAHASVRDAQWTVICSGGSPRGTARAREIHMAIATRVQKDLKERWWAQKPISTARLAAEILETIRGQDWVLVHGSLSGWERTALGNEGRVAMHRWRRNVNRYRDGRGDGVAGVQGTGQVCVTASRTTVTFCAPSGLLWTAAHHGYPHVDGHVQQQVLLSGRADIIIGSLVLPGTAALSS